MWKQCKLRDIKQEEKNTKFVITQKDLKQRFTRILNKLIRQQIIKYRCSEQLRDYSQAINPVYISYLWQNAQ